MADLARTARKAIGLLDLTNLNDDCTAQDIDQLCKMAVTAHGPVAGVCIWPKFVSRAKSNLAGSEVKVVTVANFPAGGDDPDPAKREVSDAIEAGADEVDVVIPWKSVLAGDDGVAVALLQVCRSVVPADKVMKVILETGALKDDELIRRAARIALEAGADFLKTSTGKVAINATPHAAEILIEEISMSGRSAGFKAAGGLKTVEDAAIYLDIAARIMGREWATPDTFRFGASSVLNNLLAILDGQQERLTKADY